MVCVVAGECCITSSSGATLGAADSLAYIDTFGVYDYSARSSLEVRGERSDTGVWFDADTGALRELFLPNGPYAGNAVSTWLWGLHYGDVGNYLPYRAVVALLGLIVASGRVVIWASGGTTAVTMGATGERARAAARSIAWC
jgi:hypothetical protein